MTTFAMGTSLIPTLVRALATSLRGSFQLYVCPCSFLLACVHNQVYWAACIAVRNAIQYMKRKFDRTRQVARMDGEHAKPRVQPWERS